jgi:hypothetical protein
MTEHICGSERFRHPAAITCLVAILTLRPSPAITALAITERPRYEEVDGTPVRQPQIGPPLGSVPACRAVGYWTPPKGALLPRKVQQHIEKDEHAGGDKCGEECSRGTIKNEHVYGSQTAGLWKEPCCVSGAAGSSALSPIFARTHPRFFVRARWRAAISFGERISSRDH